MNKQLLILAFTATLISHVAEAQSGNTNFARIRKSEQLNLWKDHLPDDNGTRGPEIISDKGSVTRVSTPRLIIHRPKNPNGTAVLVISGGGYAHIEMGKESRPAADWLQSEGVTAFELIYRLPQEGWKSTDVPFEDAQRAIRVIRSIAGSYAIDPHKIGILGFSAGGHLAGITSTLFSKKFYEPADAIDALSARPDFEALIYPVITMLPPDNRTHALKSILGTHPTLAQETDFSVEQQVGADTPPTFLAQSADDPVSPVENSYLMNNALKQAKVSVEMHIFPVGGHGWGMGKPGSPVSAWPDLFKSWSQRNGFWKK